MDYIKGLTLITNTCSDLSNRSHRPPLHYYPKCNCTPGSHTIIIICLCHINNEKCGEIFTVTTTNHLGGWDIHLKNVHGITVNEKSLKEDYKVF